MTDLRVEIRGLTELQAKLRALPQVLTRYLSAAGEEAGHEIISTQGLQRYPPATAANQPPTPYYIRGRGTQLKSRNLGESQRYGSQFVVTASGMRTTLGNRASYAKYLTDEIYQARAMQRIGWRKMIDVAKEKLPAIIRIFEGWIQKGLRDQNL